MQRKEDDWTMRKKRTALWMYVLLIAGMVIVVLPMVYMISTSLKPNGALSV